MANSAALAEALGVTRQCIWRDRRIIATIRPLPPDEWDEVAEVDKILADYQNQIAQAEDELERLEGEAEARSGTKSVTGLYSVRVNLLRELRQIIESRSAFLLSIGYIKAAPQRFEHEHTGLDALRGEALDKEIEKLEGLVNAISGAHGPGS
jgi:sugar-specific transcriptional regulator TrmB